MKKLLIVCFMVLATMSANAQKVLTTGVSDRIYVFGPVAGSTTGETEQKTIMGGNYNIVLYDNAITISEGTKLFNRWTYKSPKRFELTPNGKTVAVYDVTNAQGFKATLKYTPSDNDGNRAWIFIHYFLDDYTILLEMR